MLASTKPKSLTAAFVSSVKEPGKYHDGKGTGLFLLVKPSRARSWVQRIVVRGKRREIGLGSARFLSLAEARELAFANKKVASMGGDPKAERDRARAVLTFEEAARAIASAWRPLILSYRKTCTTGHRTMRVRSARLPIALVVTGQACFGPLWWARPVSRWKTSLYLRGSSF